MILSLYESSRDITEWQKMETKCSCVRGSDILKPCGCLISDREQEWGLTGTCGGKINFTRVRSSNHGSHGFGSFSLVCPLEDCIMARG